MYANSQGVPYCEEVRYLLYIPSTHTSSTHYTDSQNMYSYIQVSTLRDKLTIPCVGHSARIIIRSNTECHVRFTRCQ